MAAMNHHARDLSMAEGLENKLKTPARDYSSSLPDLPRQSIT